MSDHLTAMLLYFPDLGYFGEGTDAKVRWAAEQARGEVTTLDVLTLKHIHSVCRRYSCPTHTSW